MNALFRTGRKINGSDLIVWYKSNGLGYNRICVCAGKKTVGGAVRRNRAKRLLREAYRLNRPFFRPGFDLALVAKGGLPTRGWPGVKSQLVSCLTRAGLLKSAVKRVGN